MTSRIVVTGELLFVIVWSQASVLRKLDQATLLFEDEQNESLQCRNLYL